MLGASPFGVPVISPDQVNSVRPAARLGRGWTSRVATEESSGRTWYLFASTSGLACYEGPMKETPAPRPIGPFDLAFSPGLENDHFQPEAAYRGLRLLDVIPRETRIVRIHKDRNPGRGTSSG
jgi:hypothetical protein